MNHSSVLNRGVRLLAGLIFAICGGSSFSAANAAAVRGKVVRASGEPAVEVRVRVVSETIGASPFAFSGEDGMYFLHNIPEGKYTVEIWATRDAIIKEPITVAEPLTDFRVVTIPVPGQATAKPPVPATKNNASKNLADIIDGEWRGTLAGLGAPVVFHLNQHGPSTSDSPNELAYGIPVQLSVTGNATTFNMLSQDAKFQGQWNGQQLEGVLAQNGSKSKLVLSKLDAVSTQSAFALVGTWQGVPVGLASLPLTLRVKPDGSSAVDSPGQKAFDVPAQISAEGGTVSLNVPDWSLNFIGNISGKTLSGTLVQFGKKFSIEFRKQN